MRNHVTEFLDDYLLGGMDPAARASVEAHLAGCRSCRAALEAAREASEVMRWLPNPEAPPPPGPDFYYRVQASIEKQQSRGWLLNWTAGLQPRLAVPALMMGLLLLALMVIPRRGTARVSGPTDGWEEVEFPSADFAAMTYSNDHDEAPHDRMMYDLVETPVVE
jgi:anti-sigma factor RsiW